MTSDAASDPTKELIAGGVLAYLTDVAADEFHGISAVRVEEGMAVLALGSTAINDGHEVSGDDDAVLVFLLWVLGDAVFLYDFHVHFFYTRKSNAAEPVSLLAYVL